MCRDPTTSIALCAALLLCVDRDVVRPWQAPLLDTELSLPLPPLPAGARFDSQYDVVLLIDQREQYSRAAPGARTMTRTGVCSLAHASGDGLGGGRHLAPLDSWLCSALLNGQHGQQRTAELAQV
jgi:hypothetical protein